MRLSVLLLEWVIQVPQPLSCLSKDVANNFEEFELINVKTDRTVKRASILRSCVQLTPPSISVWRVYSAHGWIIIISRSEMETALGIALHTIVVHQQYSFDEVSL